MEITRIEPFLKYFDNIRVRTERVLDHVPVEQADWRPEAGAFSFCDIIRHLGAIERWMFAENVSGRPSRYPGHGPELARGLDAARAYLTALHAQAMSILAQLTEEDLRRPCTTPGGATMPSWKWLRAMVEHEVHHRGQVYLMLRLRGVPTPPLYGLTSEDVRARSAQPELPYSRVEQT
jgi:uncharacterized damage-inducible protein DinB